VGQSVRFELAPHPASLIHVKKKIGDVNRSRVEFDIEQLTQISASLVRDRCIARTWFTFFAVSANRMSFRDSDNVKSLAFVHNWKQWSDTIFLCRSCRQWDESVTPAPIRDLSAIPAGNVRAVTRANCKTEGCSRAETILRGGEFLD
jgi:hypothetical protein